MYQFQSIEILQSLLVSMFILLIVELVAAAAAVPLAVAVDNKPIDMADAGMSLVDYVVHD